MNAENIEEDDAYPDSFRYVEIYKGEQYEHYDKFLFEFDMLGRSLWKYVPYASVSGLEKLIKLFEENFSEPEYHQQLIEFWYIFQTNPNHKKLQDKLEEFKSCYCVPTEQGYKNQVFDPNYILSWVSGHTFDTPIFHYKLYPLYNKYDEEMQKELLKSQNPVYTMLCKKKSNKVLNMLPNELYRLLNSFI